MSTEKASVAEAEARPALAGVAPDRVAPLMVAEQGIPSIGAYRTDDHQYYFNGFGPVPSVTTILGVINKPAVSTFRAKEAARAVLTGYPADMHNNPEAIILWALKEADKIRDTAAVLGTSVHLLADLLGADESDPKGFEIGEREKPYALAFLSFLARYGREAIVSSEHMVWSDVGYAGTYDLIMRIPGQHPHTHETHPELDCIEAGQADLWLIDIKTSGKGPYPDWGIQLAGYGWADRIIVPGNPVPFQMPAVDRFGVLHIRPDLYPDTGWRLIEYPVTERDYQAFLSALDLYLWSKEGRFTKKILSNGTVEAI